VSKSINTRLTEEVILGDEISIPYLQREVRWNFELDVARCEKALFLAEHDLLLGTQVVEWEQKSPVEVAFARQRSNIDTQLIIARRNLG